MSKASAIFANKGLRRNAEFLEAIHPRAIDYLSQCPALVFAFGVKANTRSDRLYVASRIGGGIERGEKLPKIMAKAGLAHPLRKLQASALCPSYAAVVRELNKLSPSVLAQAIPEKGQRAWLAGLRAWIDRFNIRSSPILKFEWIARHCPNTGADALRVDSCADYVFSNPGVDISRWSWRRMLLEVEIWHDQTTAVGALKRLPGAIQADTVIDLSDWPAHTEIAGYEFFKLSTPEMLITEGRRMRHCVASYLPEVLNGCTSIFSMREGMVRVATLQVKGRRIVQLKGFANREVPSRIRKAAERMVKPA